jgi:hypothetical protein
MGSSWFLFFLRLDTTWPEEGRPRRSWWCPWLLSDPMKPGPPVCQTGVSNFSVLSRSFQLLFDPCANIFGDSAGESITSCTSSMKKGSSGVNQSDLDKNNIIKPTFDNLTEEDHKALEIYRAYLDDLFYSHYEVTWQGLILKETMPIIIRKAEVTPEVWSNPSLSLDDVQSMINYALERQAKSSDKLMHRLIE